MGCSSGLNIIIQLATGMHMQEVGGIREVLVLKISDMNVHKDFPGWITALVPALALGG